MLKKLYKSIHEVPIVVEATMEQKVIKMGEIIKGFQEYIQDLQLSNMPGTQLEMRKGRERMETTIVAKIKKIEGECAKLSEENVHVWKKLIEDMEMKAIESKLIESQE